MDSAQAAKPKNDVTEHGYSVWHRMLEVFGIVCAYAMVTWLCYAFTVVTLDAYEIGETALGHWLLTTIIGALLMGYLLADFASGVVHWTFDRYGTPATPLLGPNFVTPFRHHHVDPKDITRHDFIETNGNNCLATFIPLALLCGLPFDFSNPWVLFPVATLTFGAVFTFATNQFHKWAHESNPGPVVAWLQEKHIILPRDHHDIHHTFPYETHYCITTGWMNAILVKVGFWWRMEALIEKLSGIKPYRDAAPVDITR
jgi:ubiquitin-conjugating enzyme E2 variant